MKHARLTIALLAATLALVVVGCGGSDSVPGGSVAVVDGTEISQSELDTLIEQAKKSFEATKQEFPKVGTPEYRDFQQRYVAYLVQKTEFEQAAEDLGLEITDKDVKKARDEFVKSRFDGNEKKLADALEEQGLTEKTFEDTLRVSVLSQKLFDAVTKDVQVTEAEILASYSQNQDQYRTKESREVRHLLVAEKTSNGQVDYAKSKAKADQLYAQLKAGADFAELARRESDDPGSKDSGGKLTISRGETVPEFEETSFKLETGAVSKPVKTQFGYHIIEALSDVKPEKVTPLSQVRESIKTSLLQDKKNQTMTEWVQDLQKRYKSKVSYASGFAPPDLPETTETDTTSNQ